jgi:hypothetical protein
MKMDEIEELSELWMQKECEPVISEEEEKTLNVIKDKERQNKFNFIVNEKPKVTHDDVEKQRQINNKDVLLERKIPKDWREELELHKLKQEEFRKNNKTPTIRGLSFYRTNN